MQKKEKPSVSLSVDNAKEAKEKHSMPEATKQLYKRRTNSTLTTTEMFVALSDMLPDYQASCPNYPNYPAEWFDLRDLNLCYNVLRKASDDGECIIYNFGVGPNDPFLKFMGSTNLLKCQIYAFDPFVEAKIVKDKNYGSNIHFYEIGLWNGYSNRTVGKKRTGRLMSLGEIQQFLNHTDETHVSLFRSDCEGCEYGWVQYAMEHDESFFTRVDQMFLEIHTVPIKFMSSIDLEWTGGMPPSYLLEPVYEMLTKYFRILGAAINPGGPPDRNRVPAELQQQGVLKYPCCREMNLINKRLAAPLTKDPDEMDCDKPNHVSLDGFRENFRQLFRGRLKNCTGDVEPQCDGGSCYCPDVLDEDMRSKKCLVYFFGNLRDGAELRNLDNLTRRHQNCSFWAYDPRMDEQAGYTWLQEKGLPDVMFRPWALYSGHGPRMYRFTHQNGTTSLAGELYTMAEITLSWTQGTVAGFPRPRPSRISLMRIDWSIADPCLWQKEILSYSKAWWGEYKGADTVQQLM